MPATGAKWSTWKRYCDSAGVSMGRAVTLLIDRELFSVFGDVTGDDPPVFAPVPENSSRSERPRSSPGSVRRMRSKRGRERGVSGCDVGRMNSRPESGEQTLVLKLMSRDSTGRVKIGRNERCPCGSGLKYKHCHGLADR